MGYGVGVVSYTIKDTSNINARCLLGLWTSIGSMMLGFDYVIGGQLAALSQVQQFFGVQLADGSWVVPAYILSAWGSIGLGCDVIAAWLAAPLLEKYGRKPLILFCALVSTVAIILQQLAPNWRVHLAGRAVNGRITTSCSGSQYTYKLRRHFDRHHVHYITTLDRRDVPS